MNFIEAKKYQEEISYVWLVNVLVLVLVVVLGAAAVVKFFNI